MGVKLFTNESVIEIPSQNNHSERREFDGMDPHYVNNFPRRMMISYATTGIKVTTTSKLIDVSSFISSVGGNLGLFVGFSFTSMFFIMYDKIEKFLL